MIEDLNKILFSAGRTLSTSFSSSRRINWIGKGKKEEEIFAHNRNIEGKVSSKPVANGSARLLK